MYLPEEMALLRFRSLTDFDKEILPAGHHYVKAGLYEMLVFVRPDKILLLSEGGESTEDVDTDSVKALAFVKEKAVYEWYEDDGKGKDFENPANYGMIEIDKAGTCVYTGCRKKEIQAEIL